MRLDILISYSYSEFEDRDLYVTGDLYENDVVTPAMIIVPRRSSKRDVRGLYDFQATKWVFNSVASA
ncbi:hypothetical protein JHK87_044989 [Glycine soja]|nr:hypothetical protein JHK87_044989 [Glycine soja]